MRNRLRRPVSPSLTQHVRPCLDDGQRNSPSLLGPSEAPVVTDVPILPTESPGMKPATAEQRSIPPAPLPAAVVPLHEISRPAAGTRLVKIKDQIVAFARAPCKRASRAARPSEPSTRARDVCRRLIQAREGEFKGQGRTRLSADDLMRYRSGAPSGGKGPSIRAQLPEDQARMNHIAQLKARNVETSNTEASFLMWGQTATPMYDRLAESALRSNAVNSSVTKRKETQGAAYRTLHDSYQTLIPPHSYPL